MDQSNTDLRLYCFGGFHLVANNMSAVIFGTNKARALLVYLAVEAPRSFRRSHLAGLLWSDCSENQALHNLRQTIYRLRKTWSHSAGSISLFETKQDTICINPEILLWVDVITFEKTYRQATKYFNNHLRLDRLDIIKLIQAVDLFKGPFLNSFTLDDTPLFDDWAAITRERINRQAVKGMSYLCEFYERRGYYITASHFADRIVNLNPWDEHAVVRSMRLSAMCRNWGAASRSYYRLKMYLKKNLAIEPDPLVTALYEKVRSLSITGESLPPRIVKSDMQLPEASNKFVGREQDIALLVEMLVNPKIRLISLIGMGGIGKTRLATEVAHRLQGLYKDGIFFISLGELTTIEAVSRMIESRLGFKLSDDIPIREQILNYYKLKQSLLIIDSFENFLFKEQIKVFLSQLLNQAPDLKVLVTSREYINLYEEHAFMLKGLDCQKATHNKAEFPFASDATQLFKVRALQINSRYVFDENSLPLIQKLCCAVDGHPLSIELMASAVKNILLDDLLSDFESNLLSLASHFSNAPHEKCNLSLVMESSWHFLDHAEQKAMCLLSVFRGGFSEKAAPKVAKTSKNVLNSLVDKCLIRAQNNQRFDLHEIILQFSKQKSIESGLIDLSREAHANFYIEYLRSAQDGFWNQKQKDSLEIVEADLENILYAWQFYVENKQINKLYDCIDIVYQYFNIRTKFKQGFMLLSDALKSVQTLDLGDAFVGMLSNRLGFFAHRMYKNETAFQLFLDSLNIFNQIIEPQELGLANLGLANYYLRAKDIPQALDFAENALECFQKAGNQHYEGIALYLLGLIKIRAAEFQDAKQKFNLALVLSRRVGDERGTFLRLNQLAGIACNEGDFDKAEQLYLESLDLCRSFKDLYQEAIVLNNLASVYHPRLEYDKEDVVLRDSMAICREIGDREGLAVALSNLAELSMVKGDYQNAIDYSAKALEIALELGEDWTIIATYDILGQAYARLDQTESSQGYLKKAIQLAFKIKSWDLLTRSIVNLAEIHQQKGDLSTARTFLVAALSHPSILFEYRSKGQEMLKIMGFETPEETNESHLIEVLADDFSLYLS